MDERLTVEMVDDYIAREASGEETIEFFRLEQVVTSPALIRAALVDRDAAERLADERLAHAHQLQADIEAEQQGRLALRRRFGAREDETTGAFLERLATMAGVVPVEVHERGWQWRPTDKDQAFAPPFGTIRQCRVCGCLVAGGPTACARCAKAGV